MQKLLLNLIFFMLPLNVIYAQSIDSSAVQKLEHYSKKAVQEKLFAHTDKSVYLAGELMWFKLYLMDGSSHSQSTLSSVSYLEIFDWNQKVVLQTKVSIKDGSGNGSLYLPVSLASGNYKIRAYTNWMKNFDAAFFFEKNITIINSVLEFEVQKNDKATAIDIQFFPEGGTLLAGVESKVAFKAVDQYGKSIDFTGTLVNSSNEVVANLKPSKFGIGAFTFNPQANQVYKTKIRLQSGQEQIKEFIRPSESGYAMQVNDQGSGIQVKVTGRNSASKKVYLIAHTRQQTKVAQVAVFVDQTATFTVDKTKLGDGISHFTIFTDEMKPVCERLCFKRPSRKLLLDIKTNEQQYAPRQKVDMSILATKEDGKSAAADMSVSVFLADSLNTINQDNIISYLWLSSDLKGSIEHPEYYLNTDNTDSNQALDNLLLTQGWRRFKWDDVLQTKPLSFSYQPEYENSLISGRVIDKRTNRPAANIPAYLSVLGQSNHMYGSVSDASGKVAFHTRKVVDRADLVLQTDNQKDSLYKVELDEQVAPAFTGNHFSEFNISENKKNSLLTHSIAMQVQNVYSADKLKRFSTLNVDTSLFYGNASDKKYLLDKYTRFPTMEEVLREYVAEVFLKKNNKRFQFTTYNVVDKYYLDTPPLVLLDGVPVFDEDKIVKFDPLKIKQLDVVAKKYFLGTSTFGGILNFSTYKNNLDGFELDPNVVIVNYEGLQLQREFYSPVYDNATSKASRLPDFRNLLFWSPDVKTDATGATNFNFYTSDQKGKYVVVLQGLGGEGRAGYKTVEFEVVK